jgi:hypothetical protein
VPRPAHARAPTGVAARTTERPAFAQSKHDQIPHFETHTRTSFVSVFCEMRQWPQPQVEWCWCCSIFLKKKMLGSNLAPAGTHNRGVLPYLRLKKKNSLIPFLKEK